MYSKYPSVNLIILDGWGVSPHNEGNAIQTANTPFFNSLLLNYPSTKISAASDAVGLSWGEPGNSEVGHLNLGAGRVVWQELPRIDRSIIDKSFFENPAFLDAAKHVKKYESKLHLLGLVSPGGVHSHIKHLFALLSLAKREGLKEVFIHMITDGRDSPPRESLNYLSKLSEKIKKIGVGRVATIIGRYYAMDRDNRWERILKAYQAFVYGKGQIANSPEDALMNAYNLGQSDEFILPQIIVDQNLKPLATIQENDAVIFFNFRSDRARQLNSAFCDSAFNKFPTFKYKNLFFVAMTQYEKGNLLERIAFAPIKLTKILAEVISKNNLKQLRLAETEKYAHVTYFFSGGVEKTFPGEARAIIPSPKVDTYDQKPEMSAQGITDQLMKVIPEKKFQLNVINFANCDMVGHTGNLLAAKTAVQFLDQCMAKIIPLALEAGTATILTADHGNAEEMIDPERKTPMKEHTTNPVPLILITPDNKKSPSDPKEKLMTFRSDNPTGILADVAPTILELLQISQPPEMDGMSLINNLT
jgi:2,3-bisphosphoglycerate-independent phosphoglycerate mutase